MAGRPPWTTTRWLAGPTLPQAWLHSPCRASEAAAVSRRPTYRRCLRFRNGLAHGPARARAATPASAAPQSTQTAGLGASSAACRTRWRCARDCRPMPGDDPATGRPQFRAARHLATDHPKPRWRLRDASQDGGQPPGRPAAHGRPGLFRGAAWQEGDRGAARDHLPRRRTARPPLSAAVAPMRQLPGPGVGPGTLTATGQVADRVWFAGDNVARAFTRWAIGARACRTA
jgi:hypothetical protein